MDLLATLGLNLPSFLWHTANFLFLIFILRRILYKPIVAMLDERRHRIEESMARAEQVRIQAEEADRERQGQLGETRREIQGMLTQATQMSERIQSDARQAADRQAQAIIDRAQQEARAEREQSMAELRREVANLSIMAAERVINRNLDDPAQRRLVEEFLAERPTANGPVADARGVTDGRSVTDGRPVPDGRR